MSKINVPEKFTGTRYSIVAWANDQEVLYYHEFGSYQGEWVLVSLDEQNYYIWKGSYGSCSGCDSYEARMGYGDDISKESALNFAKDYRPSIEVPCETMKNLVEMGTLLKIFPANFRDNYSDISLEEVVADTTLIVKVRERLRISADEILEANNAEIKQRALKAMGYENFIDEANPTVIHVEGENQLLGIKDLKLLYLKDSSTDRRYLLRVPPSVKKVREGIAWTFNLKEGEYQPIIET